MLILIGLSLAAVYAALAIEAHLSPIWADNAVTRVSDWMEERAIRRATEIRLSEAE